MLRKTFYAIGAIAALLYLALIATEAALSTEEQMFARRAEYRAAFAELKRAKPALFEQTPCFRSIEDFGRCLDAYAEEKNLPATQRYQNVNMFGHLLLTAASALILLCFVPIYLWGKELRKYLRDSRRARWRTIGHAHIPHPPR